jgi:ParB-like chromosome segregation protein Spo0J
MKSEADGIPVYCAHDKIIDIIEVVPNPRNPNKHPDSQIDLLARIIKAQGWRNPIVISKLSGFITKGHGRLLAAQKLGVKQIPVDYQDYANPAAEWADIIADNRLSELSEIDLSDVKEILDEIEGMDVDLTGYNVDDFLAEISEDAPYIAEPPEDFKEFDENIDTQYCCPKCGYGWSGKPKPNE